MSDFDKEAEREKLREKYEREQADREATQRMSDLLLKGATMTNTHCNTCGDPLFRQNGATFCPSCHGGPEAVEGTDLEAEPATDEPADEDGAEPSSAAVDAADDGTPTDAEPSTPTQKPERTADRPEPTPADRPTPPANGPETRRPRPADSGSGGAGSDDDLETAHASLTRALERFAREAATTDDPRYARECLEAAHEAADTLSALER